MDQIIVVGGGLAGLSAAHTAMERGSRVLLIDKNPFMGGNSTKATSGINGSGTRTQRKTGIQDSPETFEEDTIRGGAKSKEHARVLTWESGPGVEWLIDNFGLDLSLVGGERFWGVFVRGGRGARLCGEDGVVDFSGWMNRSYVVLRGEDDRTARPPRSSLVVK